MYLTAKEVKDKYKITSQTLHNWRNENKIVFFKTPSGKFLYTPLESNTISSPGNHVFYARVSNTKQKSDLERQKIILRSHIAAKGNIIFKEYDDIASGMNEARKGFNSLIDDCSSGLVQTVYITYKDRLTRFGFAYIETFLKKYNVNIVVLNSTKEEDFQTELTEDLISIIHHFSMKVYSNRRKKLKDFEKSLENIESEV